MKIGISQRVEKDSRTGETRDSLDQNWYRLLNYLKIIPIPLSNLIDFDSNYYNSLGIEGIILTGGNDLSYLRTKSSSEDRDLLEKSLIKVSIELNKPILGICRGLQMINSYFGGKLKPIKNHVDKKNTLYMNKKQIDVICYHSFCITKKNIGNDLEILATDSQGNIEALRHKKHAITGIMWHPEREYPYSDYNLQIIKKTFLK